jgi:hypothetical protein
VNRTAPWLPERLHSAGLTDVVTVTADAAGPSPTAGLARRADGTPVLVYAFDEPQSDGVFAAQAEARGATDLVRATLAPFRQRS